MALTNYNIDCLFFPLADNLDLFVHYINSSLGMILPLHQYFILHLGLE